MPNFTIRLQTSPGKDVGESVSSLPPLKSPEEPWISGDTVPATWTIEVVSAAEVNKIIDKKIEELTIRVAKLEARLKGSERDADERNEKANQPAERTKAANEKVEADKKVELKNEHDENPEQGREEAKASSDQKSDSEKQTDKKGEKKARTGRPATGG